MKDIKKLRTQKDYKFSNGFETKIRDIFFVQLESTDEKGNPTKFVIGMQRPSTRSFWKIPYLNKGVAPVESEDPEVAPMIKRCVMDKKTLIASLFVRN